MQEVSEVADTVTDVPADGARSAVETQIEALVKVLPRIARIFKSQWRGLPLSVPQMSMLVVVQDLTAHQGGANPSELADRFCLSGPAVTAALDELVEKGYCRRSHSEKDRRKVVVAITPEGAAILTDAQTAAAQSLQALLSDWDQPRLGRLLDALLDLDAAADAYLNRHG
jgi:DNA-binding MarR family transcriptional regulator